MMTGLHAGPRGPRCAPALALDLRLRLDAVESGGIMKQLLRSRAVLALIALALTLGALLILSDEAITSHFNYKFF
jgi:hypothetical protein